MTLAARQGLAARSQHNLAESIAELREIAGGRDDVLAEAAGITAGSWYAWPSTHVGHELIAAGMLIMAGGGNGTRLDYDVLERWTRVGYEREMTQGRAVTAARSRAAFSRSNSSATRRETLMMGPFGS